VWSVMIPVFNCGEFLAETLWSVLRDDPGVDVMQITVVDDASTDVDVRALVTEIGGSRVEYVRHATNVGSVWNFNTCVQLARGRYVHLLHGDDRVLPGYYASMERLFRTHPDVGACFSRYRFVDEKGDTVCSMGPEAASEGVLEGWLERIASMQIIQYAAISVRRDVYEHVGGFYGVTYGEDWEMWVRIASRYPVAYSPDTLAEYRMHRRSISADKYASGQNTRDLLWVMRTVRNYLPPHLRGRVWKKSTKYYAHYGVDIAWRLWRENGNRSAAAVQVREALRLHSDLALWWKILKLYGSMLMNVRPAYSA
jgi:glycosyltransferase involved in cell wall biosynthesis